MKIPPSSRSRLVRSDGEIFIRLASGLFGQAALVKLPEKAFVNYVKWRKTGKNKYKRCCRVDSTFEIC